MSETVDNSKTSGKTKSLLYRLKNGPLNCIFCSETFGSFKDLWAHFLRHCNT